jgi:hypothetical protein
MKNLFLFLFSLIFLTAGCRENKTYWKISAIYKENGEPLRGMNLALMRAIVESDFHLRKNGDTIRIDFPRETLIRTDTVRTLKDEQERYPDDYFDEDYRGQLMDSVYFIGIERGKFKVKFINSNTNDDDKRTVIEFEEMSEPEYFASVAEADSLRKERNRIINEAALKFRSDSLWNIKPYRTEEKENEIFEGRFYKLQLPAEYNVIRHGGLYGHKFDNLKVGLSSDEEQDDYFCISKSDWREFHDATITFSVAPGEKFDFDRYVRKEYSPEKILYQTGNSFVAVDFTYDADTKETELYKIIFFKHFYTQGTHVIFSSELPIREGDLSIAKEQFAVMQSLSVK